MAEALRVRAVVIGGGVVGCAVLWELTRQGIETLLVEAEPDVGEGASKANSAIVHTGFDSHPGTIESRELRRAAELWPDVVETLGVPFLPVGALMLARTDEERGRLAGEVAPRAAALGVRTVLIGREELSDLAPYLGNDIVAALSIPDEGVIDPFWLTRAYAEAAIGGGGAVRTGSTVVDLAVSGDAATIRLEDGSTIVADQAFNCAGLRADEIARLAGDGSFAITPRKGQFLVSEEMFGIDRIVLPIPGPLGKGMLVTPIVFGGLLLGPSAVDQADKSDRSTDPAERDRILAACRSMVPAIADAVPIRSFAGLRTVSSTGDYVIRPSAAGDRLFLVAGIRSTGISASPAIAEEVVAAAVRLRGWDRPAAPRGLVPPPLDLPEEPGEVVCLCRGISRGELVSACRRPLAPTTIDALKRRGGVTFGDCQGNLCLVETAAILATEQGVEIALVERHRRGSWLFARPPTGPSMPLAPGELDGELPPSAEVVIVGGGRSGIAAAAAVAKAELMPLVLEHGRRVSRGGGNSTGAMVGDEDRLIIHTRATVIGLFPGAGGWTVLVQRPAGSADIEAGAVILATGGYVQPREHRRIAGPRPSGIITSDLAMRALGVGLLPGRRFVVVGATATADAIASTLVDARGQLVDRLAAEPDEVRGDRRLEAVRSGTRWIDCDTLVLADRLLPQPFLLRGLGLIDGRPGIPAPIDADGRLPLPGLWAAGTCAQPDIDHRNSVDEGRAVGTRVAAELVANR